MANYNPENITNNYTSTLDEFLEKLPQDAFNELFKPIIQVPTNLANVKETLILRRTGEYNGPDNSLRIIYQNGGKIPQTDEITEILDGVFEQRIIYPFSENMIRLRKSSVEITDDGKVEVTYRFEPTQRPIAEYL